MVTMGMEGFSSPQSFTVKLWSLPTYCDWVTMSLAPDAFSCLRILGGSVEGVGGGGDRTDHGVAHEREDKLSAVLGEGQDDIAPVDCVRMEISVHTSSARRVMNTNFSEFWFHGSGE